MKHKMKHKMEHKMEHKMKHKMKQIYNTKQIINYTLKMIT